MYENTHTLTKTFEYIRYAIYNACLWAWNVEEAPAIHEIKEILAEDGISKDMINKFLPESKLKVIGKNLPSVRLVPYRSLSETLLLPSDIGFVKTYVDLVYAELKRIHLERMIKDPEFRRSEEKAKKCSPVFDKIWQKILKAKATS